MGSSDIDEGFRGQVEMWKNMLAYADLMTLKCALDLRIADIIHSHSSPITLSQIASTIAAQHSPNNSSSSSSIDTVGLERVMRLLVRKRFFSVNHDGGEAVYGPTNTSTWLLHDSDQSLEPFFTMLSQPWYMSPWHYMAQCVKEGGVPFERAHGCQLYEFAAQNAEASAIFNKVMAAGSRMVFNAIMSGYKQGFNDIGSLVDVGGGTGRMAAQIATSYPRVKIINYDLPHVIATAPAYDGLISHLEGDMFESIPTADAVFLKMILHNWSDENCVKILKNCKKAIPEKTGKIIIVDVVVEADPEGNGVFDDLGLAVDLTMYVLSPGGKERTEVEWKKVLEEGGFPSYKIIKIPAIESIIEAYPY